MLLGSSLVCPGLWPFVFVRLGTSGFGTDGIQRNPFLLYNTGTIRGLSGARPATSAAHPGLIRGSSGKFGAYPPQSVAHPAQSGPVRGLFVASPGLSGGRPGLSWGRPGLSGVVRGSSGIIRASEPCLNRG